MASRHVVSLSCALLVVASLGWSAADEATCPTGPECPESREDANPWDFPAWDWCRELAWGDCLEAIERHMMEPHADTVRREPGALHFATPDGDEFVVRDDDDELRPTYYNYWGRRRPFHLLRLQFYEGAWYGLVHESTGRMTRVVRAGLPVISPDGDWMVSAGLGEFVQTATTIDVWARDDDGFVRSFDTRIRAGERGQPLLRWIGNESVVVCWYDDEGQGRRLGVLERDGDGWTFGRTGGL